MANLQRWLVTLAALGGALGVVAGALGAHALALAPGSAAAHRYDTAVIYLLLHAGVVVASGTNRTVSQPAWLVSNALMLLGMLGFSGGIIASTYLALEHPLPVIPAGGTAFIMGWLVAAGAVFRGAPKGGAG
jgi:uncharacterized membrane protein YgdD (TMEM256/DUF423 family)